MLSEIAGPSVHEESVEGFVLRRVALGRERGAKRIGDVHRVRDALVETTDGYFIRFGVLWTMRNEWAGIDKHRLDKYCVLARQMQKHVFQYMQRRDWETNVSQNVANRVYRDALFGEDDHITAIDVGIKLHVAEAFGEEIRRFDLKENDEKKKNKSKKSKKGKRSSDGESDSDDDDDKENVDVTDDEDDFDAGRRRRRKLSKCFSSRSCTACDMKHRLASSNGARAMCLTCFVRRTWIHETRRGTKMGGC